MTSLAVQVPLSWSKQLGLGIVAIALIFALLFPTRHRALTDNEGIFISISQDLDRGAMLYVDVWEHKPPLFTLHYWLLRQLSQDLELARYIYVAVIHSIIGLIIVGLARQLGFSSKEAWFSCFFYSALNATSTLYNWIPQLDLLMLPPLLASFWIALQKERRFALYAGIFWALAFFTKQTALFYLPLFGIFFWGDLVTGISMFFFGADLVAVGVASKFLLDGRIRDFFYAVSGAGKGYVDFAWSQFFKDQFFREQIAIFLATLTFLFGGVLFLALLGIFRDTFGRERLFVGSWLAFAFLGVLIGGTFLPYYFMALLPPLVLAATLGLRNFKFKKPMSWLVIGWTLCIPILACYYRTTAFGVWSLQPRRIAIEDEVKQLGTFLKQRSRGAESLLAWSNQPQIYAYSGMRISTVKTPAVDSMGFFENADMTMQNAFNANRPDFVYLEDYQRTTLPVPRWLREALNTQYVPVDLRGISNGAVYQIKASKTLGV